MQLYQIMAWFKRKLLNISLPHRKMIGNFVYGLLNSRRIGVAAIGRGMKTKTNTRYNIKRVARFLANDKINIDESMMVLQKILYSGNNRLLISIDWTLISGLGYQTLKATVVADGRGLPFYFKTFKYGDLTNKQTFYEKKFIKKLREIIPNNIEVIIIADRGFGMKPELVKYIAKIGFNYVMRTKSCYSIESDDYKGQIKDLKIKNNLIYDFKNVKWPKSKQKKTISRFVISKKKGCKEEWVLATNLNNLSASTIVDLYYKRMTIEETFRDQKNVLNGFALEKMRLSSAIRYDKMFLIISYCYLLIMLFGLYMEQENKHKEMMVNTVKYRSFSLFQVGLHFYKKYDISIPKLLLLISKLIV
jgi:hypothetical protein